MFGDLVQRFSEPEQIFNEPVQIFSEVMQATYTKLPTLAQCYLLPAPIYY